MQRGLGVLADRRLESLNKVDELEKRLKGVTPTALPKWYKTASDNEKKAADAFQLELKQAPEARDAWLMFQKQLNKDTVDERPLWLLAAKHLRDLPEVSKK